MTVQSGDGNGIHASWTTGPGIPAALSYAVTARSIGRSAVVMNTVYTTSADITGLANGGVYTITVVSAGQQTGESSAPVVVLPAVVPNPLTIAPILSPGPALDSLVVSWVPPLTGTAAPLAAVMMLPYPYSGPLPTRPYGGSDPTAMNPAYGNQPGEVCGNYCTSLTFRSLLPGHSYQAQVFLANASGSGLPVVSTPLALGPACGPASVCVTSDTTSSAGTIKGSADGMLNTTFPAGSDLTGLMAQLNPQNWRGSPYVGSNHSLNWADWDRAASTGAKTTLLMSDITISERQSYTVGSDLAWQQYYATITAAVLASGRVPDYWELMNEPDRLAQSHPSLPASATYHEFLDEYRGVRSVDPTARIIAPSFSHPISFVDQWSYPNEPTMDGFLDYAAKTGMVLYAIDWHEIDDYHAAMPHSDTLNPSAIADSVATMRALIAKYPAVGQPQVWINEYTMPTIIGVPGWQVAYMAALEQAGVDAGGLSCWRKRSACFLPDLDGLVASSCSAAAPCQTNAAWWVYKTYGAMIGRPLDVSTTTDDTVSALATTSGDTTTALIGRSVSCLDESSSSVCTTDWKDPPQPRPATVDYRITVPAGIDDGGTATVSVAAINPSLDGQATLPATTTTAAIVHGVVDVALDAVADGSAYVITVKVSPPGYWLAGGDGGIFAFGNARYFGSMGGHPLNQPIVGMAPTSDGGGYWLVAADGGIFAFGDAGFYGSTGSVVLNQPMVGVMESSDGRGYTLVAADGGVFAFGDARFTGSCPAIGGCGAPARAVAVDGTGHGYWVLTLSGAVVAFGDAPVLGDAPVAGAPPASIFVDFGGGGYWVAKADGSVYGFGDVVNEGGVNAAALNVRIVAAAAS